jgi:DNA ligase-1
MTKFPTLYKLNSQGKLMQWDISVDGTAITTTYGQVGGALQTTTDVVSEGKNLGRKNATTAEEQAAAEAKSSWEIQQRIKGYVADAARAERGENDRVGGYEPMLAQKFFDSVKPDGKIEKGGKAKIRYPAAVQPKLDGMRAPGDGDGETIDLFSRNGKPIKAVPHLAAELSEAFAGRTARPDGELYNHEFKADFEELISIVRKGKEIDKDRKMQYHMYDIAGTGEPFLVRSAGLRQLLCNEDGSPRFKYLRFVETRIVQNEAEAVAACEEFLDLGYEGAIIRNLDSDYQEDTRSWDLQKMIIYLEDEFEIADDFEEGTGKLMGHVGAFWLKTKDGRPFKCKMGGKTETLKAMFDDHSLWKGKKMTVKFKGWTKAQVPRCPVGKAIRDYE